MNLVGMRFLLLWVHRRRRNRNYLIHVVNGNKIKGGCSRERRVYSLPTSVARDETSALKHFTDSGWIIEAQFTSWLIQEASDVHCAITPRRLSSFSFSILVSALSAHSCNLEMRTCIELKHLKNASIKSSSRLSTATDCAPTGDGRLIFTDDGEGGSTSTGYGALSRSGDGYSTLIGASGGLPSKTSSAFATCRGMTHTKIWTCRC